MIGFSNPFFSYKEQINRQTTRITKKLKPNRNKRMTTNEADTLVRSMIGAGAEVEQIRKIHPPYSVRIHYTITLPDHKAYLSVRPKKHYFFFTGDEGLFLSGVDRENFNVLMSDDVWELVCNGAR